MTLRQIFALAALALGLAIASTANANDASAGGVTVSNAWARATPGGAKVGAAYMTIKSDNGDTLLAASSDAAAVTELHTHILEGDVMKMRKVDSVEISKGGSVSFEPHGYHVMLIDLKKPLKEGDTVKLTLKFKNAGDITAEAKVQAIGATGPAAQGAAPEHHHDHH